MKSEDSGGSVQEGEEEEGEEEEERGRGGRGPWWPQVPRPYSYSYSGCHLSGMGGVGGWVGGVGFRGWGKMCLGSKGCEWRAGGRVGGWVGVQLGPGPDACSEQVRINLPLPLQRAWVGGWVGG